VASSGSTKARRAGSVRSLEEPGIRVSWQGAHVFVHALQSQDVAARVAQRREQHLLRCGRLPAGWQATPAHEVSRNMSRRNRDLTTNECSFLRARQLVRRLAADQQCPRQR
jgi:hypothetical protein